MNNNIDTLKKKILYRSNYRGTKEMDNLIGSFVKSILEELDLENLELLNEFIEIDDDNLLKFYRNLDTEIEFKKNVITQKFKNFKLKAK